MEKDIGGTVWRALIEGLPPEEQAALSQTVTRSLGEQRAAVMAPRKPRKPRVRRPRGPASDPGVEEATASERNG